MSAGSNNKHVKNFVWYKDMVKIIDFLSDKYKQTNGTLKSERMWTDGGIPGLWVRGASLPKRIKASFIGDIIWENTIDRKQLSKTCSIKANYSEKEMKESYTKIIYMH